MQNSRLEVGSSPVPGWKLVELRGRGGFADVWEAINPAGQRMAIKFLANKNSGNSVKELRIIQAIKKIEHPNIIHIERIMSIPGYVVIMMELADGSLFDLLEAYQTEYQSTMTAEVVLHYLSPIAEALDHLNAHEHLFDGRKVGFQHADIKPSNLLLFGDTVKLGDFGLCRPTSIMNASGIRSGTLDFAAPEFHRGLLTDQSDQYSLAITYYHLRTGTFPFPEQKSGFQRENCYTRPSPVFNGISREEARVLNRALTTEPSHRWKNCRTLMQAIRDALEVIPVTPIPGSQADSKFGTVVV